MSVLVRGIALIGSRLLDLINTVRDAPRIQTIGPNRKELSESMPMDHASLAALPAPLRMELAAALMSLDGMIGVMGARFVAGAEIASSQPEPTINSNRGALAALPYPLREELADALATLDAVRIAEALRRISKLDPSLGGFLEHQAGRFGTAFVLQALRSCPCGVQEEGAAS
jgi:hypothetical protein